MKNDLLNPKTDTTPLNIHIDTKLLSRVKKIAKRRKLKLRNIVTWGLTKFVEDFEKGKIK